MKRYLTKHFSDVKIDVDSDEFKISSIIIRENLSKDEFYWKLYKVEKA